MRKSQKGLAILGSTGSIGRNTLEIVRRRRDGFKVISLCAGSNTRLLKKQAEEFKPRFISVATEKAASELKRALGARFDIGFGEKGAARAASFEGVDVAVSAISGAAGLLPTLSAIRAGKDIALANKETLVMAGPLVMNEVKRRGVRLMPVDSEHSAVFQALAGHRVSDVRRIILTASGGPFLKTPLPRLKRVTPGEALNHPKWDMGRKITIDSATLVNKGLEVIEARWLFDLPAEKISVCIHPQSIVHSMVEYIDGSIVAQMGCPDMKGPISYALSYPERMDAGIPALALEGLRLDFIEPDLRRFPCLKLAFHALKEGGAMPAVLNASDEVAVDKFLKGGIAFTDIYSVISGVLERYSPRGVFTIEDVIEADRWARAAAEDAVRSLNCH